MSDGARGLVGYDSSDSDAGNSPDTRAPVASAASAARTVGTASHLKQLGGGADGVPDRSSASPRVKRARLDAQPREDDSDVHGTSGGVAHAEITDAYIPAPHLHSSSRVAELAPAGDAASERPTSDKSHEQRAREEPSPEDDHEDGRSPAAADRSPGGHLTSHDAADSSADGEAAPAHAPHFSAVLAAAPGRLLDALPPQSAADAPPAVLARFRQYLALSAAGHSFTGVLKRKREFGNPCVLDKVIAHFGIAQHGESSSACVSVCISVCSSV